jgi:hypothetical protein
MANYFTIKPDNIKKLLNKCKKENIKLNGCLTMIQLTALKMLLNNNKSNDINIEKEIQFHTPVTIRNSEKFKEISGIESVNCKRTNELMGKYALSVIRQCPLINIDINIDINKTTTTPQSDNWCQNFWQLAKADSFDLHSRIENNDHLKNYKFQFKTLNESEEKEKNEMPYLFETVNIGNVPSSMTKDGLIQISEASSYFSMSDHPVRQGVFVTHIITFDNKLCWSIIFNQKVIKPKIINEFIQLLNDITSFIIIHI